MGRTIGRAAAFRALWRAMSAGKGPGLGVRLAAMPRMIWATLRGRYDGGTRLFLMGLGALYVVSPIDMIPELFLAFAGLVDDFVVIAWIAGAFLAETDRFLAWEQGFLNEPGSNPPRQPSSDPRRQGAGWGWPGAERANGRPSDVVEGDVVG
jgi:hypothetical protein